MSDSNDNIAMSAAMSKAQANKSKAPAKGKTSPAAPQAPAPRIMTGARAIISLITAQRICATEGMAAKMVTRFGMHEVDYDGIREAHKDLMIKAAEVLGASMVNGDGTPNERAIDIHLQRIVDSFVRSAHGAGEFFDKKANEARNASSAVANADRDEDRQGIDGLENRAQRACSFAAQLGLQSYAILAAAHGAVDAYAHVVGREWKPYEGAGGGAVSTKALAVQAGAFDRD